MQAVIKSITYNNNYPPWPEDYYPGGVGGLTLGERLGTGSGTHATCACAFESEPVNTGTGNYVHQITDAKLPGIGIPFAFTRTYNSADSTSGVLGPGWTHAYSLALTFEQDGDVVFRGEDGQQVLFHKQQDATFKGGRGVRDTLVNLGDQTYKLTRLDQVVYRFDTQGRLTSIKDRNNQGPSFTYNGSSQLSTITDSAGRSITLTYTSGLLTQLSIPGSRSVSYGYTGGLLTSVTDLKGGTIAYTYTSGKLTKIVDQNNHTVVENVYGSDGRVTQQKDGLGQISTFAWDPATETSTFTDARGKVWKDVYSQGILLKRIDPLQNTTIYGYDTKLNLTSVTDPRGNATTMTYDSNRNLLTRTAPSPLSYQETYTYNSRNDPATYTNGRGKVTTYDYDAAGNLIKITRPGSVITQFGRDATGTGLITSTTDPRGKVTSFGYDASGNLTGITTQLGNQTTFGYDSSGRRNSKVDPRGHGPGGNPADYTWTYTYDNADNLQTVTDPLGNVTTNTRDAANRLTSVEDAKHHVTTYGYDDDNHLTSVQPPDAGIQPTLYTYDNVGNILTRKDANVHVTSYAYDNANRLTSVTSPTNQQWSYGYDASGNVTTKVTPLGNSTPGDPNDGKIVYSYDQLNRLTGMDYSDTTADVTFGYDANSNRISMADGAGTESYVYDDLDRLTSVTRGSNVFSYDYDIASNLSRRTYPDNTVVDYAFDGDERLSTVTSASVTVATYGYDAAGNATSITYPASNGYSRAIAYDRAGRLTQVDNARAGNSLSRFTYTLDAVGNPNQVVTTTETIAYAYDSLDRLTQGCYTPPTCSEGSGSYISYTYDGVGNRLTEVRPTGTTTYTYNGGDQLTQTSGPGGTVSYTYDQNGNQTAAGSRTFAYDLENRMSSTTSGSSTIAYSYDGVGKRLQASVGAQPSDKANYLWDSNAGFALLALERDGSNALLRRYLYGSEDLLSFYAGGGSHYYLADSLGTIANVTSSTGTTDWTFTYETFGSSRSVVQNDPLAPENPMRYSGQPLDTASGLYHLRARQYDPSTGRFLQLDRVASPISRPYLASYLYVGDRPSVAIDPTGLWCLIHNSNGGCLGGGVLQSAADWSWAHRWQLAQAAVGLGCLVVTSGTCLLVQGIYTVGQTAVLGTEYHFSGGDAADFSLNAVCGAVWNSYLYGFGKLAARGWITDFGSALSSWSASPGCWSSPK